MVNKLREDFQRAIAQPIIGSVASSSEIQGRQDRFLKSLEKFLQGLRSSGYPMAEAFGFDKNDMKFVEKNLIGTPVSIQMRVSVTGRLVIPTKAVNDKAHYSMDRDFKTAFHLALNKYLTNTPGIPKNSDIDYAKLAKATIAKYKKLSYAEDEVISYAGGNKISWKPDSRKKTPEYLLSMIPIQSCHMDITIDEEAAFSETGSILSVYDNDKPALSVKLMDSLYAIIPEWDFDNFEPDDDDIPRNLPIKQITTTVQYYYRMEQVYLDRLLDVGEYKKYIYNKR